MAIHADCQVEGSIRSIRGKPRFSLAAEVVVAVVLANNPPGPLAAAGMPADPELVPRPTLGSGEAQHVGDDPVEAAEDVVARHELRAALALGNPGESEGVVLAADCA